MKPFPWKCEHLTLEAQNTCKEPGVRDSYVDSGDRPLEAYMPALGTKRGQTVSNKQVDVPKN